MAQITGIGSWLTFHGLMRLVHEVLDVDDVYPQPQRPVLELLPIHAMNSPGPLASQFACHAYGRQEYHVRLVRVPARWNGPTQAP